MSVLQDGHGRQSSISHMSPAFTSSTAPLNGTGEGNQVGESYRAASTPFQHNHQVPFANGNTAQSLRTRSGPQEAVDGPWKKRRGQRTSGGFLLDSARQLGNRAIHTRHNASNTSQDKGKAREVTGDGLLGRNKNRLAEPRGRSPLGHSPLMMEVEEEASQTSQTTPNSISSSDYTHVEKYPSAGQYSVNGSPELRNRRTRQTPRTAQPPAFDADPTEIVNLALNLSESRRRQTSFGRFPQTDSLASRRIVSTGQNSLRDPYNANSFPNGSLKQHLQQQRKISRNYSPKSATLDEHNPSVLSNRWREHSPEPSLQDSSFLEPNVPGIAQFHPSDATLLRVERVKNAFELFYEYRRVLQYLPKLPPPSNTKEKNKRNEDVPALGREYNPLQYIRNRKTRWREKKAFNSEALGWKNLPQVREWVDSVKGERQDGVNRVDNPYPLPPFNSELGETSPGSIGKTTHKHSPQSKPQRPSKDWIFEASDLLADAYWLDQVDNAALIEDRDGNKLFDSKRWSRGRFGANWEKAASIRRSLSSTRRPSQHMMDSRSSSKGVADDSIKDYSGRTHRFRESITSLHGHTSSTDRKSRWHRRLMRSRDSSSSGDSRTESLHRQGKVHSRQDSRDVQGSAVLEKQMMDLLAKEADNLDWGSEEDRKLPNRPARQSREISPGERPMENANGHAHAPLMSRADMVDSPMEANTKPIDKRGPPEDLEERGRKRENSLDGIDSTGPNSPTMEEIVPSISISLSAPASRSVSPEKGVHSAGSSTEVATELNQSVDAVDFASKSGKSGVESVKPIIGHTRPLSTEIKTPIESLLSPRSAEGFGRILRHQRSNKSMKGPKQRRDSESRFRLLKGGRLAEFVGNEVSRVGDMLWRGKESSHNDSNNNSAVVSPTTSAPASDISDSDDDTPPPKLQRTTSNRVSQLKSDKSDGGRPPPSSSNLDHHRFNLNNLPSFRSPLRRGEQASPTRESDDPIARQQAALRERGRPRGFERLAPPRLDMRSVSESPSPDPLTRVATRETADSTYESRGNSVAPSEINPARSDMKFKAISGLPQHAGATPLPITGLASYDGLRHNSIERPKLGSRQWSISDRGVSAVRGAVTRKDLIRARALLLSSGVKAVQIARKANSPRGDGNLISAQLQHFSPHAPVPTVARKEEHILATRIYVKHINGIFDEIRAAAHRFESETLGGTHAKIRILEERIEREFTPRVRGAADAADALGVEVANRQRLVVKRLDERVERILRRRRRRMRWIRRGGYLLLEWVLLGAMWWIWLIVVAIRLVKGFVRGIYRGVTWLLWL